jgi:hypothetical protein
MNATDFEAALLAQGFYFINPSLFVPEGTATYATPEDFTSKVLSNDADNLSKCIRRRSEQANAMTYYAREQPGTSYFRVNVPTGTGTPGTIDVLALKFRLKQICDTIAIRLGIA